MNGRKIKSEGEELARSVMAVMTKGTNVPHNYGTARLAELALMHGISPTAMAQVIRETADYLADCDDECDEDDEDDTVSFEGLDGAQITMLVGL